MRSVLTVILYNISKRHACLAKRAGGLQKKLHVFRFRRHRPIMEMYTMRNLSWE